MTQHDTKHVSQAPSGCCDWYSLSNQACRNKVSLKQEFQLLFIHKKHKKNNKNP